MLYFVNKIFLIDQSDDIWSGEHEPNTLGTLE